MENLKTSFPKNNFKTKTKREDSFVKKRRLSPDKINYHFIRLMSFTDCPRCANQGLVIDMFVLCANQFINLRKTKNNSLFLSFPKNNFKLTNFGKTKNFDENVLDHLQI